MWIKIDDAMYNTDDFCSVELLGYGTIVICKNGRRITLSKAFFQRLAALLNPKEVN